METTLYDDDSTFMYKDGINSMKRNMTLDLASPKANKRQRFGLLSSPDLNMLKLASPELEKMIIAHNGLVTTTPTPTQFLFPRPATEEQEVFARGFTDVLAKFQTDNPNDSYGESESLACVVSTGMLGDTTANTITSSVAPLSSSPPMCHRDLLGNIPTSSASYPTSSSTTSSSGSSSPFITVPIKDEPQTVPSLGNSPPMSPIDMENQEKIKLERKRQRNRLAASKCRRRKLERIAKLEDKVRMMKNENSELSNFVTELKDQVCALKQEVMRHSRSGCQIMTTDIITSHI